MKNLRVLLLALILGLTPALAWAAGWLPLRAVVNYQGPGDITSFQDWFGFRCYSLAFSGSIADITDSATGNTTGTQLRCTGTGGNGIVSEVVSSSACTFVIGNACSTLAVTCAIACNVANVYSQTGNANCTTQCIASQLTNALRPTFIASCQNGRPCMMSDSTKNLSTANRSLATQTQPWSMSHVANSDGSAVGGEYAFYAGTNENSYYFNGTVNLFVGAGGTPSLAATNNVFHALQAVANGSASILYLDGAQTTGLTAGAAGLASADVYVLGANNSGAGTIKWAEAGAASGAFSTPVQSSLNLNERAYWNF